MHANFLLLFFLVVIDVMVEYDLHYFTIFMYLTYKVEMKVCVCEIESLRVSFKGTSVPSFTHKVVFPLRQEKKIFSSCVSFTLLLSITLNGINY